MGIVDGVAEITLNQTMTGETNYTLQGYVDDYIATNHPDWPTSFEHIVYHIPDYDNPNCAFAYIGWYKSVFENGCIAYLSIEMHEIGHNLRMNHNKRGTNEYGDNTGYMGKSYSTR
jgi:hypothetical protein